MRDIKPLPGGRSYRRQSPLKKTTQDSGPTAQTPRQFPRLSGTKVPVSKIEVPGPPAEMRDKAMPSVTKEFLAARKSVTSLPLKLLEPSSKQARLSGRERGLVIGILIVIVIVTLLAVFIFLPKAHIELTIREAPLLLDQTLTIEPRSTSDSGTIPGRVFFQEIPVGGTVPASGSAFQGEAAKGAVTLVNRTTERQSLKTRSRLVTEDGTLYYLTQAVTIPAGEGANLGSVTATIEAGEPGPDYNIEPQRLNFVALDSDAQQVVYAELENPITGGSGEPIMVVSEADIAAARIAAHEAAREEAQATFSPELREGWAFLDESWTIELASFEAEAAVGDKIEAAAYQAEAMVWVFGYEEELLASVLEQALTEQLEHGSILYPAPIEYTAELGELKWDEQRVSLKARVSHSTIPEINLDTLPEKLAGRSGESAVSYLEALPGVQAVTIELSPFFVPTIPRIEERISVELKPQPE